MNKWILLTFIVFLLGWTASSTYSSYDKPEPFRMYTEAVCEQKEDYIFCHDEIFIEYEDIKYQLPRSEKLGQASHSLDWKDPRQ